MAHKFRTSKTKIERWLADYGKNGNQTHACEVAGISSASIALWRKNSPEFLKAFERATAAYCDTLRKACHRRAVKGTKKPIYQGGKLVGYERRYSDKLLTNMMQAHVPEYRERDETINLVAQVLVTPVIASSEADLDKIEQQQIKEIELEAKGE